MALAGVGLTMLAALAADRAERALGSTMTVVVLAIVSLVGLAGWYWTSRSGPGGVEKGGAGPAGIPDAQREELQALAMALTEACERIRETSRAQDRFISHISHELKTPIATLLVESQTIERDRLPPDMVRFVEGTEDEMRRLGRLVESLVSLVRIRSGQGLIAAAHVALNDLVLESVLRCSSSARQRAVALAPTLEADGSADTEIAGNTELLQTMLDDIIRRAIHASPRDAAVRVNATARGNSVTIAVTDERPRDGMVSSQEDGANENGRAESLASDSHLSLARTIAELHGGHVAPLRGARITGEVVITLPRAGPAARSAAPAEVPARAARA